MLRMVKTLAQFTIALEKTCASWAQPPPPGEPAGGATALTLRSPGEAQVRGGEALRDLGREPVERPGLGDASGRDAGAQQLPGCGGWGLQ